jgi:two-component system, NarL family, response regulator DegU
MSETPITVLIADDHPIFRRGLRQLIESDAKFKIVAEAEDGDEALDKISRLQPQVAILDVEMPNRDGLEVLKTMSERKISTAIVLLTMYKEDRFFNSALDAGVKGYVLKDSAITEITSAIRAAAAGENFISPTLSTLMIKRLTRAEKPPDKPLDSLTVSERRVLKLVAEAKNNQQIADELFVSVRTVENHRSNICAKLNLDGKNSLLIYALTHKSEI